MKGIPRLIVLVLFFAIEGCGLSTGIHGAAPGGGLYKAQRTPASFVKPVSFSVLQDYPKGEDLNQVALDFRLMKELGVTTWRGSFSWIDYEPERGRFDLAWLRRFVALAAQQGIALRPYLAYTPRWAAKEGTGKQYWNDPPRQLQDWRIFVSTVVGELKGYGNIRSYEIYNEENVRQWWEGSSAEYNSVLRTADSVVKSVSPGTRVLLGGMVYPDWNWVEQACVTYGNAAKFDVLPFHAYPETWTPPGITVENYLDQGYPGYFRGKFLPLVEKGCSGQPVWINEAGFATSPGKSERDQANWWARSIATFLAAPRVEHLGIYQIRDRKPTARVIGGSENYYLGITRADRTKKVAFYLLKRLIPLLNTGTLTVADGELKVEVTKGRKEELYCHLFVRPDGVQVLFVWDRKGSPTLRIKTRPGSKAVEYALDGTSAPFRAFEGDLLQDVRLVPGAVRIFVISR